MIYIVVSYKVGVEYQRIVQGVITHLHTVGNNKNEDLQLWK